jgi:F5/8 type C domain
MSDTAVDQPRAVYEALRRAGRAFFLLEAEEQVARSLPADRGDRMRRMYEAAEIRTTIAADLSDPRHAVVGVTLYCDAVALLLFAVVLMHGDGPSLEAADAASIDSAFARYVEEGAMGTPPREVDEARHLVAEPHLRMESLGPEELATRRASLEAAAQWLRGHIEPRTVPQIRRVRIKRLAGAAIVAAGLLGWALASVFSAPNVALHRPVTASSLHQQSVAPGDGSGLVDGVYEINYGIHTGFEATPWVMVDLQSSRKIAMVKVYNRADGWFDEGLPFVLELSQDGKEFNEVARRTEPFSQALPWTYSGATEARYVRIRAPRLTYIALSEVEIFER